MCLNIILGCLVSLCHEKIFLSSNYRDDKFSRKKCLRTRISVIREFISISVEVYSITKQNRIQNSKRYIDMSFGWGFARLRLLCSTVGLLVTRWMCAGRAAHFAFALLLVHFSFIQFVCRLKTCFAVTCLSTLRGARTTTTRRTRVLLMRLCTHVAHWMCVGRATCVHAPKQVWYTTPHIYI